MLQKSQLRWAKLLDYRTLMPKMVEDGIIQRGVTSPVFLQARADAVINPDNAYHDWNRQFLRCGIYMPRYFMEAGSYHADVFTEGRPLHDIGYFDSMISQFDAQPAAVA